MTQRFTFSDKQREAALRKINRGLDSHHQVDEAFFDKWVKQNQNYAKEHGKFAWSNVFKGLFGELKNPPEGIFPGGYQKTVYINKNEFTDNGETS